MMGHHALIAQHMAKQEGGEFIPIPDPFFWWDMNEVAGATTAQDQSVNGLDGLITGELDPNTMWIPGYDGNAADFTQPNPDLRNQIYLTAVNAPLLNVSGSVSYCARFRTTVTDTQQTLFSISRNQASYFFFLRTGGPDQDDVFRIVWSNGTQSGDAVYTNSSSNLFDGNWHTIVARTDGSEWTLFVDGVEVPLTSDLNGRHQIAEAKSVKLGAQYVTVYNLPFTGAIDDFRQYHRKLTDEECVRYAQGLG